MRFFYIILVVATISFQGCRSKKKITDRQKTELNITQQENSTEITEKDISVDSTARSKTETITTRNDQEIIVKAKDSTVEIIEERTATGKKYIITGAKDIAIRKSSIEQEKTDTTSTVVNRTDTSKTIKTEEITTELTEKKKSRKTDSESTGLSFGVSLGIGMGLCFLLFLVYRRWKSKRLR